MKDTATPAPLPAGGQAPALLTDREKEFQSEVEQLKHSFGRGGRRAARMTPAEFDKRRREQKKALQEAEALRCKKI